MTNRIHSIITALMILTICLSGCGGINSSNAQDSSWEKEFGLSERKLATSGKNDYFVLEPHFQLVLESAAEKLIITVLDETKVVDGITTRVVEEREWINDQLKEVSRNFFAIDEKTHDVFYFGEEVDMYKDGKLDSHTGAWLAGENGAKAGLIMPGKPKVGMKYYQEIAPGRAMDRATVIKLDDKLETPAGSFSNCLLTKEGTALNAFELEFKTYAPGIGLLQDEKLLLTKYGFIDKE